MKTYTASYESNGVEISNAEFHAENLKAAKSLANSHKRHTPEITKHRYVKTIVRLNK